MTDSADAGLTPGQQRPQPSGQPGMTGQPGTAQQPGAYQRGDVEHEHVQLLESRELESMITRWEEIQAKFVDDPRKAVQDADALVGELMQRLTQMFASERDALEAQWSNGSDVSTEDLRQGLRRYRSFFERLLSA